MQGFTYCVGLKVSSSLVKGWSYRIHIVLSHGSEGCEKEDPVQGAGWC